MRCFGDEMSDVKPISHMFKHLYTVCIFTPGDMKYQSGATEVTWPTNYILQMYSPQQKSHHHSYSENYHSS